MTRYSPSRHYLTAGFAALAGAVLSSWLAFRWMPSLVPSLLFFLAAIVSIYLALRPPIEIHPHHLRIGNNVLPWDEIRGVDRTGWVSPLVLFLTLAEGERKLLIYPGSLDTSHRLLRHIRRSAREAFIDGVPYREFWGEHLLENIPDPDREEPRAMKGSKPRYPMLRAEDEAEVERLYQRLKAVGHLDPKGLDENS